VLEQNSRQERDKLLPGLTAQQFAAVLWGVTLAGAVFLGIAFEASFHHRGKGERIYIFLLVIPGIVLSFLGLLLLLTHNWG
jgi:hypothetical protein